MNKTKIDINNVNTKIQQIFKTINELQNYIDKINKKINTISKLASKFINNKTLILKDTNTFLKFQKELLNNQKIYYSNMKTIIYNKFCKELTEISELIIMTLVSLKNLEIDYVQEINNILKKLIIFKKNKTNDNKIIELTNSTINNLSLIDEFLTLFDKYIVYRTNKNKKENIHCNNFELDMTIKKNVILIEYNKFSKKIIKLVDYFVNCCNVVNEQLNNTNILNFVLEP